jgi:hypothetical protein
MNEFMTESDPQALLEKNQTSLEINEVISQPYKYGFQTNIEKEKFPTGLST